jgi:hypothetical protein
VKVALRLLLLVGFAALGLFVFREVPRCVTLVYAIEDAPAVRRVEVEVRRGTGVIRPAEFRFATVAESGPIVLPIGDRTARND